jgi:hypothetical protein|tara:strand:- start:1976 stop:2122 length:147 start_codon:yes stop_codon:yes gene_type:complete
MKLEINEVYVAKTAIEAISIKGSDARAVADLLDKLDKEFDKLQKAQEK